MSSLGISFSGLSLEKLNQQWRSPVDSPEKSVLPNFNLFLKFNQFFVVSGVEIKNLQVSEQAFFLFCGFTFPFNLITSL